MAQDVSRMIFVGGILGSTSFLRDLYLNSTTCSSHPGVGGNFFLTLAPFLLHLISQSVSQVIRSKSLKLG